MKIKATCLALLIPAAAIYAQNAAPPVYSETERSELDDASDRPVSPDVSNVTPVTPETEAQEKAGSATKMPVPQAPKIEEKSNGVFTSVSLSKQFRVSGKDAVLAGVVSARADELRAALLKVLKQEDKWKNNIEIHLMGQPGDPAPANPVRMRTTIIEESLIFNIYVHLGRGINQDRLRHAVITTMIYEMVMRKLNPEALQDKINIPDWLITGLEQAVLWQTKEADRKLYATLFRQHGIMSPDVILTLENPQEKLDATSYVAYQTTCGALVLCLLNQEHGAESMKNLLDRAILGDEEPKRLISRHFPQLNITPSSLHKWWTLQLSRMADTPVTESLTLTETEGHLKESLLLVQYDPASGRAVTFPLDDLDRALTLPDLNRQLTQISNSLVNLSRNAFPSYRPIIIEYAKIVLQIRANKLNKEEATATIKELQEVRDLSMKTARRVRDYLDWYELNTRTGTGKTFESYAATMKMLREKEYASPTPISRYLDDIEKLYTQPGQAPLPKMHGNTQE